MADTVNVFPTQKLTIKSMRGSHFKLVVNIKNSDNSNYNFTDIAAGTDDTEETSHTLHMRVYTNWDGTIIPLTNTLPSDGGTPEFETDTEAVSFADTPIVNLMSYTVEDGKLTIEWDSEEPYSPIPGTHKYHIYTISNETINSEEVVWLYGSFVVVDNNPAVVAANVGPGLTENFNIG